MSKIKDKLSIAEDPEYIIKYIKKRLSKDIQISNLKIKLKNNNQIIFIYGIVDSLWKRKKILELLSVIPGINSINNRIRVLLRKGYDDNLIKDKIEKTVKSNVHITSTDIKVEVKKGTVKLTGTVENWEEYKEIYNSALYTDNVIDINTKLYKAEN